MIQRLIGMFVCLLLTLVPMTQSAGASVHVYHERPGQTTLRSQQSLRDRNNQAWQTILFKRNRPDGLEGLYLRLVGFPGVVTLDAQRDLTIATGTALQWQAKPRLDSLTPTLPDNTNQYDVTNFIADLPRAIPLTLTVPLQGRASRELVIPPYAVQEWRELADHPFESPL